MNSSGIASNDSLGFSITITERPYYSYLDEKSFYGWLEDISSYESIKGTKNGLVIKFSSEATTEILFDLIALMRRYEVDASPVFEFCQEVNPEYFDSLLGADLEGIESNRAACENQFENSLLKYFARERA